MAEICQIERNFARKRNAMWSTLDPHGIDSFATFVKIFPLSGTSEWLTLHSAPCVPAHKFFLSFSFLCIVDTNAPIFTAKWSNPDGAASNSVISVFTSLYDHEKNPLWAQEFLLHGTQLSLS